MPPRRSNRLNTGATPTPTPTPEMNSAAIEALVAQHVADAIANYENNRNTGSGQGGSSSQGNHQGSSRVCSYKDFQNCKPKPFNGTEGVIGLTRWIENMESVFQVSFCTENCKVRYAACTFSDSALTWWNGHVQTMGIIIANAMTWEELKQLLVEEYCPRGEIQNLEQELWNLAMNGSDITAYTTRFNDLAALCPGMVTPEYKKIERYIWGLAPQIQGMVTASRPTTFDSAKRIAVHLTNQGVRQGTMVQKDDSTKDGDNKRKSWDEFEGNSQQFPRKKQETVTAYAATTTVASPPQKQYIGRLPRCNNCSYHHLGDCRELFCYNCNRKGHTARFCRSQAPVPNQETGIGGDQMNQ